jgi:hypothetical protein
VTRVHIDGVADRLARGARDPVADNVPLALGVSVPVDE